MVPYIFHQHCCRKEIGNCLTTAVIIPNCICHLASYLKQELTAGEPQHVPSCATASSHASRNLILVQGKSQLQSHKSLAGPFPFIQRATSTNCGKWPHSAVTGCFLQTLRDNGDVHKQAMHRDFLEQSHISRKPYSNHWYPAIRTFKYLKF